MIRAVWLAIPATAVAACLSVMAGWQRGGWLPERLLWIAIGVVLVLGAHLLPALCRSCSWSLRTIGGALWIGCMAATCFGHATFFLEAQQHAGESRAEGLINLAPLPDFKSEPAGRGLTEIARDRAATVAKLAALPDCMDCTTARVRRAALTASLAALDIEAGEARRQEAQVDRATAKQDRIAAQRDAARADPVTSRVAAFAGLPAARVDLLTGLAFAAVLEGVACFCWVLALQAKTDVPVTRPVTSLAMEVVAPVVEADHVQVMPVTEQPISDIERVRVGIDAGELRGTVAEIRRYLGCGQAKAMELRRQVAAMGETA